jgi:diaminopimelate epimerase
MCGNGSRVFARYLVAHGLAPAGDWSLATRAGVKALRVGETGDVTVDMGPPAFLGDSFAVLAGRQIEGVGVSMGNPHLVCGVGAAELDAADLGTAPRYDAAVFPDGVNVELVTPARGRPHRAAPGRARSPPWRCGNPERPAGT